jgi:lipopolysaccharide transport system ATP-binding protein
MSSETVIAVSNLGKCYQIYGKPRDRLFQMFSRGGRQYYREYWALRDVFFELRGGETFGIVGRNGAGKSTLLQLICGTLSPTTGSVSVKGRIAALLELGAGFNPEFSGRENVYLSATVMGLSKEEIDARYAQIVAFSGIGDFIDQPVKTYSSGMYVRLAFSVATSIEPDILIVDEALSVGDGEFSRKSFDRIMRLKEQGATILFCSHSLYQVEALCDRVLWLDQGRMVHLGLPTTVLSEFKNYLQDCSSTVDQRICQTEGPPQTAAPSRSSLAGRATLDTVALLINGKESSERIVQSCRDDLQVQLSFSSDPLLEAPCVVFEILTESGDTATSGGTLFDGITLNRNSRGEGQVTLDFPMLPLMRGRYRLSIYLTCERMIHVYDQAVACSDFTVQQAYIEKGVAFLPHRWETC